MPELISWKSADPANDPRVYDIDLTSPPWLTTWTAPTSEDGERCPWPWEPQIQETEGNRYRCGYCHSEVISGHPHLDYSTNPPTE